MIELLYMSSTKHMSEIKNLSDEIIEFEIIGFARPSIKLLYYIRDNNILVKIFNPTKTKGSNRSYGPIKIFGDYYRYYCKIEFKKEFVEFLVEKLYKKNPDPELGIKNAFTHILHDNGLHWEWCCHVDRDVHKYVEKRKIKKDV